VAHQHDQIEQVIVQTLEETPRGATHWSSRGMAKASGLGRTTVQQIWRAFGLQPHRSEMFKRSTDPLLIENVRDIVGLYLHPPTHAAVCCVDEKAQIQALDRTQPVLPMRPGQVERRTHDYRRHGTTTLFAALTVKTRQLIPQCHRRHRAIAFRQFLDAVDVAVPRHLDVHLIMDNYGTHKTPLIRNWFAPRPRFHVHFTPTDGSWLNLVERWFAALTNKQLRRGVHRSVTHLKAAIQEFIAAHHATATPLVWTKSADEILASIARFAQRTLDLQAAPLIARTTRSGHWQTVVKVGVSKKWGRESFFTRSIRQKVIPDLISLRTTSITPLAGQGVTLAASVRVDDSATSFHAVLEAVSPAVLPQMTALPLE
jgi:transposase